MKCFSFVYLIFYLVSCSYDTPKGVKNSSDSFVFSYSAENSAYSLKFTNEDTIFLVVNFPEEGNTYFSIIKGNQKSTLDSFLYASKFSTYDTTYINEYLNDGVAYKFSLTKDSEVNWTYIYGDKGPKELYVFAKWLTTLKDQSKFYTYRGKVNFGNLRYIELPVVQPPPIDSGENSR